MLENNSWVFYLLMGICLSVALQFILFRADRKRKPAIYSIHVRKANAARVKQLNGKKKEFSIDIRLPLYNKDDNIIDIENYLAFETDGDSMADFNLPNGSIILTQKIDNVSSLKINDLVVVDAPTTLEGATGIRIRAVKTINNDIISFHTKKTDDNGFKEHTSRPFYQIVGRVTDIIPESAIVTQRPFN